MYYSRRRSWGSLLRCAAGETGGITSTGPVDFLAHLHADAARFSEALAMGPLDGSVRSCPGWTLRDLAHHLGGVHRWARAAAASGRRPTGDLERPPSDAGLADWFAEGADALASTLSTLDPTGPTWHPFPTAQVGAVWLRRQAHETSVHRWDAETVTGVHTPIDAVLAADGIAEYFELIIPRLVHRDGRALPEPMLVELTDVPLKLSVSAGSAERRINAAAVDVAGPAAEVLLALWRRAPGPAGSPVAARWFAIGGN